MTGPRDEPWSYLGERLAAFEAWARSERPAALERLRTDAGWRFDSSVADLWMETAEAWRRSPEGPFRITARPVRERFPFGEFPTFELTIRNSTDAALELVTGSRAIGDYTSICFRIIDAHGADHGHCTNVWLEEGSIVVPPRESRSFICPERPIPYYRNTDRAMLPDSYDYHIVLTGIDDNEPFGSATSNGERFEVTDDGSVELARLRAVHSASQASARLSLVVERHAGSQVQLFGVNTGWSEVSFGNSYLMWHLDRPDGSTMVD